MTWRKRTIMELAREVFDVQTDDRGRQTFSIDTYGIEAFAALVREENQTQVQRLSALVRAQQITIDKLEQALAQPEGCQCPACKVTPHTSDCAVHNAPAYPKGDCTCGAQPEQEPVAWVHLESWKTGKFWPDDCFSGLPVDEWQPLYTTPPQRKPLTDEMAKQMKERCDSMEMRGAFADGWFSAEAAHGIKENT